MCIDEVIENQQKTANQVDGKYKVVVSGAGVTCMEQPTLEALLPGIRLHFLRYALFPKNSRKVVASRVKDRTDDAFTLDDADASNGDLVSTDNFIVACTSLNEGYVYLFNADDRNDYHELEVDMFGNLSPVIWNNNNLKEDGITPKDYRTKENKRTHYRLVSKPDRETGKKYWIGYSSVQWSYEYHKTVLTSSDEEKTQKQMILVECKGIKKGEEELTEHIRPYKKIEAVYFKDEGKQHKFKETLKQIYKTEIQEERRGGNDTYEDMFVTLHDPVGCLVDIHSELTEKSLELNALVDAIQTGEKISDALQRHHDGKPYSTFKDPEYHALFTLANTVYKMVYDEKANIEKYDGGAPGWHAFDTHYPEEYKKQEALRKEYVKKNLHRRGSGNGYLDMGNAAREGSSSSSHKIVLKPIFGGVSKEKIEGILGVAEREVIRNKILEIRNAFGDFLKSDYCQSILDDFSHNCDDSKIIGHSVLTGMISDFFVSPFDIERTLLLNKDYPKKDKWKSWVYNEFKKSTKAAKKNSSNNSSTANSNNNAEENELGKGIKSKTPGYENYSPLTALLGSNYDNTKIIDNKYGFANKFLGLIKMEFKNIESRIINTKLSNGRVVKNLNEVRSFALDEIKARYFDINKGKLLVDNRKLFLQLGIIDASLDKTAINMLKYRGFLDRSIIDVTSGAVKIHTVNGETIIDLPINREIELSTQDISSYKFDKKVAKFLNSRAFNGMLTAFQGLNMYEAMRGSIKNNFDKKSTLNTIGIGAELSEAAMNLRIAQMQSKGITEFGVLRSGSKLAGAIGGSVTSAMCFLDAYDSFKVKDVDASMAWAGAGVAFGVSTAYGTILTTSALAGPIALLATGVGMGLIILAGKLTDDDLEKYFKHFLLNDEIAFPRKPGDNPIEYVRSILLKINDLEDEALKDDDFEEKVLMNPLNALIRLYDLTVCTEMAFIPDSTDKKTETFNNDVMAFNVDTYYAFDAEFSFMSFLDIESALDCKIFLFPNGIKNGDEKEMKKWKKGYEISTDPEQPNKLKLHFHIPRIDRKNVSRSSYVLIALRINKSEYSLMEYPLKMNDQIRYLGACFDLSKVSKKDNIQVEKIKVEPLDTLKKANTWD